MQTRCIGKTMPSGELKYWNLDITNINEIETFNQTIEIQNQYLVDIHTPETLYNDMYEFPLIFKNIEYDINSEVGEYMKQIFDDDDCKEIRKTKKLISSFKGGRVLIKGDRLLWLLNKGLVITKIYGYISAKAGRPFEKFKEKVSNERRKGDVNKDYEIISEMWKLTGNSGFGRTGMNKNKFDKTKYGDEDMYYKCVGKKSFKDGNQYGDIFEISYRPKQITQNIPIQVALSIYDDAKLKMCQFYYDCVSKYIDKSNFQYLEMDTDSAYIALTGEFEDLVKPELKEEFIKDRSNWFLRNDTKENYNFYKRTGEGMICLAPKLSCKGVQLHNNSGILQFDA